MSYDGARSACQSYGGDLTVIKSAELNNLFGLYWSYAKNTTFWIGLRDIYNEDDQNGFVWVDGTIANGFTNWTSFQSSPANRDCAKARLYGFSFVWQNTVCTDHYYGLCENTASNN